MMQWAKASTPGPKYFDVGSQADQMNLLVPGSGGTATISIRRFMADDIQHLPRRGTAQAGQLKVLKLAVLVL